MAVDRGAGLTPEPPVPILLVDDREANLAALEAVLASPDYRLVRALGPDEALRALLREPFALILLDVVMPGMDGFELARIVKSREQTAAIPIIFLTATVRHVGAVAEAYTTGAVDFVSKPFEPQILRSKVRVFAELYRRQERIKRQERTLRELEREAEELRYRSLADALPALVWRTDPQGRVLFVNRSFAEVCGAVTDLRDVLHPDDARAWATALASTRSGGEERTAEIRLRCQGGTHRWYLAHARPERDAAGDVRAWVGTFTDIAQRKAVEEERARLLAREQAVRAEVEDALALRDDFIAVAAHELRTPLTALKLHLDLARKQVDAPEVDAAAVRAKLDKVSNATERMHALVEELLDVSRMQVERLVLVPVEGDLVEQVRARAAPFAAGYAERGGELSLHADEPVRGWWDPDRIAQVVANLLSNAVRFGRLRPIDVRVRREGDHALLEVEDQGIGIPAVDVSRIFDRFQRAVSIRNYGGLGLGLYVAKRLVEAHGGEIEVTSEADVGTKVRVRLPLDSRPALRGESG